MRISDWSSDVCSSDLAGANRGRGRPPRQAAVPPLGGEPRAGVEADCPAGTLRRRHRQRDPRQALSGRGDGRSEEHTSELQSLMRISYAVFCLKKKITNNTNKKHNTR